LPTNFGYSDDVVLMLNLLVIKVLNPSGLSLGCLCVLKFVMPLANGLLFGDAILYKTKEKMNILL
jgi:hypothetical protein